jgi:quercetin dioxygenase-like cupin family protein
MAEKKWEKYIIYAGQTAPPARHAKGSEGETPGTEMFYIHDGVIPGAFMMTGTWQTAVIPGAIERGASMGQHFHDTDEYICLIGSDMEKPLELNAEVEFWYEDEKYTITKSCAMFVPRGVKHAPFIVRKVDKPIFMISTTIDPKHGVHEVK